MGNDKPRYKDEIRVKMITALGCIILDGIMPKTMEKGLKETYFNSGTVKTTYLYINGKEITNNKNYNIFRGI